MIKKIYNFYLKKKKSRWMKNTLSTFRAHGTDVRLRYKSNFIFPEKISLGKNIHIGENAWWRADGGIEIGDNTIISRNSVIFTANHNYEGTLLPYDRTFKFKKITIGRNVWIGMNVMIAQGVNISDGAIISMGTVVTKDVPSLAIVGSHGSRVIKYRNEAHYNDLEERESYIKINISE